MNILRNKPGIQLLLISAVGFLALVLLDYIYIKNGQTPEVNTEPFSYLGIHISGLVERSKNQENWGAAIV